MTNTSTKTLLIFSLFATSAIFCMDKSPSNKVENIKEKKEETKYILKIPKDLFLEILSWQKPCVQYLDLLYRVQNMDVKFKELYRGCCKNIGKNIKNMEYNEAAVTLLLKLNPVIREQLGLIAFYNANQNQPLTSKLKELFYTQRNFVIKQIAINKDYNEYAESAGLEKKPTFTKVEEHLLTHYVMCSNIDKMIPGKDYYTSNILEGSASIRTNHDPEFFARARVVKKISTQGLPEKIAKNLAAALTRYITEINKLETPEITF